MSAASLRGRDVYRCTSCGTRVQMQREATVAKTGCIIPSCDRPPESKLPETPLCAKHFESVRLEFLPEVYSAYPPMTWLHAVRDYEDRFGKIRKVPHSQFDRIFYDPYQPAIRPPHEPLVYFIIWGDRCKIGTTTRLTARVSALSLTMDTVALTIPGNAAVEHRLHRRFADQRIGNTEWFQLAGPVQDFIDAQPAAA